METTFKQNQMQFENVSDTRNMSVYTYRDTYLYSRCMDTIMHVFLIFKHFISARQSNLDWMSLLCQAASIDISNIKSGL